MYKRSYFIGIFAYILMLVLSLLFYKERTIFLDQAFNLFHIIKEGGFCIVHFRFGDAFFQVFPVIGVKLGVSLPVILASYSAGFVVYYFTAYLICGSVFKRYDFALVILLVNILFVSDTFYYIPSQAFEGMIALMIVFAAVAGKQFQTISFLEKCILLLVMIVIAFYHPLVVFGLLYSVVFFMLNKDTAVDKKVLYGIAITYFAALAMKLIFFRTPYEGSALGGLKNFVTQFPDYITLFSNKRFLYNCLIKYYWMPIVFFSTAVYYIKTKDSRKFWFCSLYFFAYLALVNISYPGRATPEYYMENLYLPIGLFLALPFIFDVLPVLEKKNIAHWAIILIIASGCIRIYAAHSAYTARLNLERAILDKYGSEKVVIKADKTDREVLQLLWGTPYEFLLLSESERQKAASIIIDEHPEKLEGLTSLKNGLRVNWETYLYADLPAKYFHFTDSATAYKIDR